MKKSELKDLIERKKILKESLDIINESYRSVDEVGGFDDPEIMAQYHGNYIDELIKTFFSYDSLSNDFYSAISKPLDDEERRKAQIIAKKYISFMDEYKEFLDSLVENYKKLSTKSKYDRLPGLESGSISLNEDED